jgi:opacity protein-like surface antigen
MTMARSGATIILLCALASSAAAQGDAANAAASEESDAAEDPATTEAAAGSDAATPPPPDPNGPLQPPPDELPPVIRTERLAAKGFYSEAGLGAAGYIGSARPYSAVGPSLALRIGYDLFSWFSFGIQLAASTHEATVPPPPDKEWYQLYRGFADGRLGGRVGRIAFFVEGGLGGAYISSNVLQTVGILEPGERFSIAFTAGGGVEYQLENRHYAFGLAGDWWLLPQFDAAQGVEARLYLRYTYGGG